MFNRVLIIVGLLLMVWIVGMGGYYLGQRGVEHNNIMPVEPDSPLPDNREPVVCTLEAKICPDGSAVGRTGPNCEFAPCPDALELNTDIMMYE